MVGQVGYDRNARTRLVAALCADQADYQANQRHCALRYRDAAAAGSPWFCLPPFSDLHDRNTCRATMPSNDVLAIGAGEDDVL